MKRQRNSNSKANQGKDSSEKAPKKHSNDAPNSMTKEKASQGRETSSKPAKQTILSNVVMNSEKVGGTTNEVSRGADRNCKF